MVSGRKPTLLAPGQHLAGYDILGLLGRGGMGEVYEARQVSLDRIVALKVLAPHLAKDPAFTRRFVDEARAAGRLNHANIVHVHDVGSAPLPDGTTAFYFSMELIEGESLQAVLDRGGAVPVDTVGPALLGISRALAYAAGLGIVHRDIKPDNILLTKDGVAKLADLGLATTQGGEPAERDAKGRVKVMGTPRYMAPEQARGLPVDHRTDQYCLGATAFHLLTGQPPYEGNDPKSVMVAHVNEPVPDPIEVKSDLPKPWCELCQRLMAKEPAERFATAEALVVAIEAAIRGIPLSRLERKPFALVGPVLAIAAAGALVIGGLAFLMAPAHRAAEEAPKPVETPPPAPEPPATKPAVKAPEAPATKPVVKPPETPAIKPVVKAPEPPPKVTVAPPAPPTVVTAPKPVIASPPAVPPKPAVVTPPSPESAPAAAPADTSAADVVWNQMKAALDACRSNLAYLEARPLLIQAAQDLDKDPRSQLATHLIPLGKRGQEGEAVLRSYLMSGEVVVTLADGRSMTVHRLTLKEITGNIDGEEVTIPRATALTSWRELLDRALADQNINGRREIRAACMWWWRDPAGPTIAEDTRSEFLIALRSFLGLQTPASPSTE